MTYLLIPILFAVWAAYVTFIFVEKRRKFLKKKNKKCREKNTKQVQGSFLTIF